MAMLLDQVILFYELVISMINLQKDQQSQIRMLFQINLLFTLKFKNNIFNICEVDFLKQISKLEIYENYLIFYCIVNFGNNRCPRVEYIIGRIFHLLHSLIVVVHHLNSSLKKKKNNQRKTNV